MGWGRQHSRDGTQMYVEALLPNHAACIMLTQVLLLYPDGKRSSSAEGHMQGGDHANIQMPAPLPQQQPQCRHCHPYLGYLVWQA